MKIRPIRDLRDTAAISALCLQENAPIFITHNGREHLVIMSIETYERKLGQAEVEERINIGISQADAGLGVELSAFINDLKAKYSNEQ